MSFLAAPLEEGLIRDIRARHPQFVGEVPPQAKFWTEADLDAYFGSHGEVLPQSYSAHNVADGSTCALLTRLREKLAEARVDGLVPEYRSFCKHISQRAEDIKQLPGAAECEEVPRAAQAPDLLKSPVVVERVRMWAGRRWNAAFWRRELGDVTWKCRARAPICDGDLAAGGAAAIEEVCTVREYVDYTRVLQRMDPKCEEENGLAFPRVALHDFPAFTLGAKPLFDSCWRELAPPGIKDLSLRWLKRWSAMCDGFPHLEQFARFHRVSIAAAGVVSRPYVENHNAHVWCAQIEGSRMYFLFPPSARIMYEETGKEGVVDAATVHDYAAKVSPVDIFFPSQKRHASFREGAKAKVAVLDPGESLVIPAGWWQCSVALETSVTLRHVFWNVANRGGVVDAMRDVVAADPARQGDSVMMERIIQKLDELYEAVMDDDDPEDSDLSD